MCLFFAANPECASYTHPPNVAHFPQSDVLAVQPDSAAADPGTSALPQGEGGASPSPQAAASSTPAQPRSDGAQQLPHTTITTSSSGSSPVAGSEVAAAAGVAASGLSGVFADAARRIGGTGAAVAATPPGSLLSAAAGWLPALPVLPVVPLPAQPYLWGYAAGVLALMAANGRAPRARACVQGWGGGSNRRGRRVGRVARSWADQAGGACYHRAPCVVV